MGIFTGSIPLTRSQWSAGLSLLLVALAASLAALASYQPWVDPRLLLLHELVLPRLGIPQNVVLAAYVLLGGAYALLQRRRLLAREGAFLTLAFGLFALSLGTDIALHSIDSAVVMAEDGFKFVGIVSWMAFHVALAERFASRI